MCRAFARALAALALSVCSCAGAPPSAGGDPPRGAARAPAPSSSAPRGPRLIGRSLASEPPDPAPSISRLADTDARYEAGLGLFVQVHGPCKPEVRLLGASGPVAPTAIEGFGWWVRDRPDVLVRAKEQTITVVSTTTNAVVSTLDVALGEPLKGADRDGEGGFYAWTASQFARVGADGKPRWSVPLAKAHGFEVVGRRVLVSTSIHMVPPKAVHVLDAGTGQKLAEVPGYNLDVFATTFSVQLEKPFGTSVLHDLETAAVIHQGPTAGFITNGEWMVVLGKADRPGPRRVTRAGFSLANARTQAPGAAFAEVLVDVDFSEDGSTLHVTTADWDLVELAVPSLTVKGRQKVPEKFHLKRMLSPGVAYGWISDPERVFVRMDDGRRLWVRGAATEDGRCVATVHDDEHFTGDPDGPVSYQRGADPLAPDLVPLDRAPAELHRPGLIGEFFAPRR